ncbi:MAG: DUF4416 family protein [Candidatus Atribacteria bacterium]|nr:DUF4416 family protein [Candidatus Atribacteria bacterium]
MGIIKEPNPVKFFIAVLFENTSVLETMIPQLEKEFGPIQWRSPIIDFTHTNYYQEIGEKLKRIFLVFRELFDPADLARRKILTNQLEIQSGDAQKIRKINLDPGYFDGGKIVLATTKNFSHRVYIGKGIYAEATIRWEKGDFRPFEYTYPDYGSKEYRPSLIQIRNLYREDLSQSHTNEVV